MQTPSHLIISAVLGRGLARTAVPFHWGMFLFGAVLPDLSFALLTLGGEIYYRWFAPLPVAGMSIMEYLHLHLFFNSWWWIVPHNTFHSLVINGILLGLGWWMWKLARPWGAPLFWLATSLQLHTLIDMLTHTSDGPLLFFPLNTTYRFASPISYWEADNYGILFFVLEYTLNAVLLVYLVWTWHNQRRTASQTRPN